MLDGSAPSPLNREVSSAVTRTRILKPLRSSTLFNCRLDDEVICRKPLSQFLVFPSALVCAWSQLPSNRHHPQGARIRCALPCPSATAPHRPATAMSDETILGNPRNHRETNGE